MGNVHCEAQEILWTGKCKSFQQFSFFFMPVNSHTNICIFDAILNQFGISSQIANIKYLAFKYCFSLKLFNKNELQCNCKCIMNDWLWFYPSFWFVLLLHEHTKNLLKSGWFFVPSDVQIRQVSFFVLNLLAMLVSYWYL